MRLTKRRLLALLLLCLIALSSLGLAAYWQSLTQDDTFSSIPLYPRATNIVADAPGEDQTLADDFKKEDSSTFYIATASDSTIYDFYDKWLRDNGWERWSANAGKALPGTYLSYLKNKPIVKWLEFTGFSGPLFGAPWFKAHTTGVHYEVGLLTDHLHDLPPASVRVTLFFSKTSGSEYIIR